MKAQNVLELIGNTPHLRINRLFGTTHEVWIKLERNNPGASIKDRIAHAMVAEAEQAGQLVPDGVIIEPTSGNTGIGLAMVGAVKGYRVILVMPESMSLERRRIMQILGAELILSPREKGMNGAIEQARTLAAEIPRSWIPGQFDNPANPQIHRSSTAREILDDFPSGIDYLITGVGTGGHITGVAQVLREQYPQLKVFAVEPELSAVISGGQPGPHPIQGIGAGFIPGVLDPEVLDGVITVSQEEAFEFTRLAARQEGLLVGISSGASLAAVSKKLKEIPPGARILTFCYDNGERYLSVQGLFE
ncbi:MAG: cysteine synthase A [Bacteroidales bacterium]